MPLMREYTEIHVEESLLPQVVRELTQMAVDQNHVEVTHGVTGRVVLVHPELAEFWYQQTIAKESNEVLTEATDVEPEPVETTPETTVAESNTPESETPEPASEPDPVVAAANIAANELSIAVPVKRGPGRPRKNPPVPSVSHGEES